MKLSCGNLKDKSMVTDEVWYNNTGWNIKQSWSIETLDHALREICNTFEKLTDFFMADFLIFFFLMTSGWRLPALSENCFYVYSKKEKEVRAAKKLLAMSYRR